MTAESTEYGRAYQAESLLTATRAQEPWSEEDDRLIASPALTVVEMAKQLQRTYYGVQGRREKLGIKGYTRDGKLAGDKPQFNSPFDIKPNETVCPDCFTIRTSSSSCLC